MEGAELVLDGVKRPVESAGAATHLLVTGRTGEGLTQVLVPDRRPRPGGQTHALGRSHPSLLRGHLPRRAGPRRTRWSASSEGHAPEVERQLQLALVIATAESVGAMQTALDMTIEWAFDRYSFGRPLASYQELKHRFADMKTWLEASHAISDAAATGGGPPIPRGRRTGQRGQGLRRRLRRRAPPGLRPDPRRHRPDLRARPPPLPAPSHHQPGALRHRRPSTGNGSPASCEQGPDAA